MISEKYNIKIEDILKLLCKNIFRTIGIISACLIASLFVCMVWPRLYAADTLISVYGDDTVFITELMKSRTVLESVIQDIFVDIEDNELPTAEDFAKKQVEISNTKGTNLIKLSATGKTPEEAHVIVSGIIERIQDDLKNLNEDKMSRIENFIDRHHKTAEEELSIAEKKLIELKKTHGIYKVDQQLDNLLKGYYAYDTAIANLQVERKALQEEMNIVNTQIGNQNNSAIDYKIANDPIVYMLREQIAAEEVKMVILRQTRQDTHIDVVKSKEKLKAMYGALDKEVLAVAESSVIPVSDINKTLRLKNYRSMVKLNTNIAAEVKIKQLLDRKERELANLSSDTREYIMLSRDVNIKKSLCDSLSMKAEWSKIFKEWTPVHVVVIDKAVMPQSDNPVSPNKAVAMVLGGMIGLAVRIWFAVVKNQ